MGIQDAKQAAAAAPDAPPVPNFYCLGKDHALSLVTVERFFYFAGEVYPPDHSQAGELILTDQGPGRGPAPDMSKAPVCGVCTSKNQSIDPLTGLPRPTRVSAIPLDYDEMGSPQIPLALQGIAQRAGEA